jgi:hypothetical protein
MRLDWCKVVIEARLHRLCAWAVCIASTISECIIYFRIYIYICNYIQSKHSDVVDDAQTPNRAVGGATLLLGGAGQVVLPPGRVGWGTVLQLGVTWAGPVSIHLVTCSISVKEGT